jgi:hypothetical protein
MSTFTTAKGKGVATFFDPKVAAYRIKFTEGGELPEVFTGIFTSEKMADMKIVGYLAEGKQGK